MRRMVVVFSSLVAGLVLLGVGMTWAQEIRLPAPVDKVEPPSLTFTDNGKAVALELAKVEVNTIISGYVAQTTETMTFRNNVGRVLEGNLDFPLPEGATVCAFGLDVDGQMVDGVPVPKQEARVAFETEERKGVDPGLAEQTTGNSFRMRIFPIRPNSTRTVKVQYILDLLDVAASDGAISYRLPLRWSKPVGEFNLHLTIDGVNAVPEIRGAINSQPVAHGIGGYSVDFSQTNVSFDSDLLVALPQAPAQSVMVEQFTRGMPTIEEIKNGDSEKPADPVYFFAIHDQAPPAPPQVQTATPAPPANITVAWDVSLNRAYTDKTREIRLLETILNRLHPQQVTLIPFSDVAQPAQVFKADRGKLGDDASDGFIALTNVVRGLTYDGGLNLSSLSLIGADKTLLFTDGLVNLGQPMPARMENPVYPITADARADFGLLNRIAQQSGGQAFNLDRFTDDQVASGIQSAPYSLLRVEVKDGKVGDVLPSTRQIVSGRVAVAGKLLSPTATLVLHYGIWNTESSAVTYTLTQVNAGTTGIVPRVWAQMKLAELELNPAENAGVIADVGRVFNFVTPGTSLLVLERLDQYLAYHIVPPRTRQEMYKNFVAQTRQEADQQKNMQSDRIDQVVGEWNERVNWWSSEFKYDKNYKYNEPATQPQAVPGNSDVLTENGGVSGTAGSGIGGGGRGGAAADAPAAANIGLTRNLQGDAVVDHAAFGMDEAKASDDKSRSGETGMPEPDIRIKPWNPDTPYLTAIKSAASGQAYAVYLDQRKNYLDSPAFFLDCADFLLNHGQAELGVRVLSDIPALKLESPELLRIAGYRLRQIGKLDAAIDLFEKVLRLRPEEPQSYRDLALALTDRAGAHPDGAERAVADEARALDLLNQVVQRPADPRFPWLEVIATEEANRLFTQMDSINQAHPAANPLDPRLQKLLDLDVRVVMSWDTANTDIDLWVTEPTGEKCMYNHNRTAIGGMLSNDFTQGYGPEEYNLRHAKPGTYLIQANFYGSHAVALSGPTTIHAMVYTNWGRPNEKSQAITVRLTDNKEVVDLGTVTIQP